jgi:hypothetical protein
VVAGGGGSEASGRECRFGKEEVGACRDWDATLEWRAGVAAQEGGGVRTKGGESEA